MRWQQVARAAGLGEGPRPRPTIFAEMSALASATGAVNLGQGFPDADGPEWVREAAVAAIRAGVNQYPPGPGDPRLRAAVAAHQRACYGLDPDPDTEVLITAGATEALTAAVLALAGPGRDVVTLEPFYDSHAAAIALAGAAHRTVPMIGGPAGFRPDLGALDAACAGAAVLLLNSPHNPTGAVLTSAEVAAMVAAARRHDLVIVTDEVYEHLVHPGHAHVPAATLAPERTLSISSAGKTFSLTGWKIGWATGPAELVDAVRTVKQFLTYTGGAPFQPAIAAALAGMTAPDERAAWVPELAASLTRRRDLLTAGLAAAGLLPAPAEGTYFVLADAAPVLGDSPDAAAWCRDLPRRAGVVAVPVSAFTRAGSATDAALRTWVRFTYCKDEAVLTEAVRRLAALRP